MFPPDLSIIHRCEPMYPLPAVRPDILFGKSMRPHQMQFGHHLWEFSHKTWNDNSLKLVFQDATLYDRFKEDHSLYQELMALEIEK